MLQLFPPDTVVMLLMPFTQPISMLENCPLPQSIQPENTFWPQDAELDDLSEEPDSHHAPLSKKDEKSNELLSKVNMLNFKAPFKKF